MSFTGADDRAGDRIEFWLTSGGDVFLHRASHLGRRLVVKCSDRGRVDFCALGLRHRDRLFAAADEAGVASDGSDWRSGRSCRQRDRSEEHELVPEQRCLVIAPTALDTGGPDGLLDLGARRRSRCEETASSDG